MYQQAFAITLFTALFSLSASGEEAIVAVAANFAKPMQAIVRTFEQSRGHTIQLSFGSSGKLFAQIQNGAPYDLFLSADTEKPDQLIASGKAIAGSRFTYAAGRLALWHGNTQSGNTGAGKNIPARQTLESGDYRRLAIANPRLAPYGKAAAETLAQLGLVVAEKLVTGENISQTYQFVASGNADLGFVALSQIVVDGEVPEGVWLVPDTLHTPIRQDAVLLRHGKSNDAALALMNFLQSDAAIAIIRQYGYGVEVH